MSSNQSQQTQQKFQACRNGCGTMITFRPDQKSPSGKFIPLQKDSLGQLVHHNCANRPKYQPQAQAQPPQQQAASSSSSSTTTQPNNIAKELTHIEVQLLVLVSTVQQLKKQISNSELAFHS